MKKIMPQLALVFAVIFSLVISCGGGGGGSGDGDDTPDFAAVQQDTGDL